MQQCRHEGVILGFDFGTVRLGVAVGNGLVREARPLAILDSRTVKARWASIERVMKEWEPEVCVVGLPRHPDGVPHEMTARALRFARQLEGRYPGVAVYMVDERYSSVEVEAGAGRDEHIDDAAAAVILQQALDGGEESLWPVQALSIQTPQSAQPAADDEHQYDQQSEAPKAVLLCNGKEI